MTTVDFSSELEEARQKTTVSLDELRAHLIESNDGGIKPATHTDDAETPFDKAVLLAQVECFERTLAQIKRAIRRFDNGTFGICECCHQKIDPERLVVHPWAAMCLNCQEAHEDNVLLRGRR